MCGIAGFLRLGSATPSSADADAARRMGEALAHRGPDGRRVWSDGRIAFAHARLSIIDLEGGWQPIANEDASVRVVLNGEIYNHRALRAELAPRHKFTTRSDTEVLVHLWEEEGERMLERVHGMFAFALWDARRQVLLLARDRLGKKPLYLEERDGVLAFASEPRALFARAEPGREGAQRELDPLALDDVLSQRYVDAPRSGFCGIEQLEPGSWLRIDARGRERRRYWSPPPPTPRAIDDATALAEFGPRFDAAVACRLESDVPLGLLLSGGIDSCAVLDSMSRQLGRAVRTFTVAFSRGEESEAEHARATAQHFGAEHTVFDLDEPTMLDEVERVLAQVDVPFADPSHLPTALVCRLARTQVTVCLTGDGGDELFGGYTRYRQALARAEHANASGARAAVYRGVLARLPNHGFKAWKLARGLRDRLGTPEHAYVEHLATAERALRVELYGPRALALRARDVESELELDLCGEGDLEERMVSFDLAHTLPGLILTKADRASMAHGLELRSPLLDHALVEWSRTLPGRCRIRDGNGKWLLRRWLEGRVPAEVLQRKKRGFGTPLGRWFRRELAPLSDGYLGASRLAADGWLEPRAIATLLREHRRRARNHGELLWALLALEIWYRNWVQRDAPAIAAASARSSAAARASHE
ncbi:MAG: asparagine synthase (glutamine-hydrolyzing) [Planctomycetota bacterium]|nr:MAG: asparagine synthase (glutamine-hydrolyzing) [Planctomycetota bacterium]